MIDHDLLTELLVGYLPRQRWSGVGDRTVTALSLRWTEQVRDEAPELLWTVADVSFDDGSEAAYQLFIGARPAAADDFLQGKDRELLGVVEGPDGDTVVYDALIDPDLAVKVLHLADPGRAVEVRRPLVLEHSNSSIVFDEAIILKLFRRVIEGPHPDVEMTRTLAERGVPHVLAPLAALRRGGTDLGVLRQYLVGASDGWQLAQISVRDLLAARLPPEECGSDFAFEAERLGAIIGSLHVAMADTWGSGPADPREWSTAMLAHLADVAALAGGEPPFDVAAVRERFGALAQAGAPGTAMRIHGDLHLAQLMRADSGWYVLDFEGEPVRGRTGRHTVSSPLRDVAGMLRSLHYASAAGLAEWDEGDAELVALVQAWEQRSRAAFLRGYLGVEGVDALLPPAGADRDLVLGAFELDRAVYEVGYEILHRPEWAHIPASAIAAVLER